MLITPYTRLLSLGFLMAFTPLVYAKGGGGHGGGGHGSGGKSSSSKGSSGSAPKGKVTKVVIFGSNGSKQTQCIDTQTNQVVRCPSNNKAAIIAGSVIGGVFGLLAIGLLIYWLLKRRRRNRGRTATRDIEVPVIASPMQKEYKPLALDSDIFKSKEVAEDMRKKEVVDIKQTKAAEEPKEAQ